MSFAQRMESENNGRVRIVINALSARQGGGQTYLINLLQHLPEDIAADIYILSPESLVLPTEMRKIERIPVKWPVQNPVVRAIWEKLNLQKILSSIRADVLFCPGGIIGVRAPRGCKTVTMFRNMIPFNLNQRRRYKPGYMRVRNYLLRDLFLRSMLRADLVIFLSDYAKEVVESHTKQTLKKTVTIPHGLASRFRDIATENVGRVPAWLPPEGYFLYVSTLDYYKNQIQVVQAFAILKQMRPTAEKLLLVGPEYPEYGQLVRRELHRLSLENDVLVTGPISYSEMPSVYGNAVVNIFASDCENCPNVLIEALSAGRPVF
jgi:glycosyltransferase involved in cell wall biosynthesis